MKSLLFFAVSFAASVAGAICGIGGGVIIKPALDLFGWESVSTISFLSGCTVLSMSGYSVCKSMLSKENNINPRTATPLSVGAAIGGVAGKQIFNAIRSVFENRNSVGAVQAACLALIIFGALLYTVNKSKMRSHNVTNFFACAAIGFALGMVSSFLGIGGGPVNLVVLYFFSAWTQNPPRRTAST